MADERPLLVGFQVSGDLAQKIENVAAAQGLSTAEFIRQLVSATIDIWHPHDTDKFNAD